MNRKRNSSLKRPTRSLALAATTALALLFSASARADCSEDASGASATGGSECTATTSTYSATNQPALIANGQNSILTVSGVTAITGVNNSGQTEKNASGLHASDGGVIKATFDGTASTIDVSGHNSMGLYALNGGRIDVVGKNGASLTISTNGHSSRGFQSEGAGSVIDVSGFADKLKINVAGYPGYSNWDQSAGLYATSGGKIVIDGGVDITTGVLKDGTSSGSTSPYIYGIVAKGDGSSIEVGHAKIIAGAGGEGGSAVAALAGSSIKTGTVDIYVGATGSYAHGILVNDKKSVVTIGGGTIVEEDKGQVSGGSAVRALAGTITVNGNLNVSTKGTYARGLYASAEGIINLNGDTSITTFYAKKSGQYAAGIQLGRSRKEGSEAAVGSGFLNSYGALTINQQITTSGGLSPAIYVERNSVLKADYATSSTRIDTVGTAITYGSSDDAADIDTVATISLNNAVIATSSATADLIRVGGRVMEGSFLALTNGSAVASPGGWLITVTDKAITDGSYSSALAQPLTKSSNFAFKADNMKLQGSVNTVSGSQLHMTLDNGSVWTLAPRTTTTGPTYTSTLTELRLNNSTLDASGGDFTIVGNVTNGVGVLDLSGSARKAGQHLTIEGDYVASGDARLQVDTTLGDSASLSDILTLRNASVAGRTEVVVHNDGGLGAQTTGDGILVVETDNAKIAAGTDFWAPKNSVKAGLYAYNMMRGTENPNNWYLSSEYVPPLPPTPPEPGTDPTPKHDALPNIRVEVPVYMTAPALANRLGLAMLGTYHDRVGEDYADTVLLPKAEPRQEWCGSGRKKYRCPVEAPVYEKSLVAGWARLFGMTGSVGYGGKGDAHGRWQKFSTHGPSYDYDLSGFQAGFDLYRKDHADGQRDIAGLYVGYGWIDSDVRAVYGGKAGDLSMNGYTAGAYWTRKGASGWYVDAVVQGMLFDDIDGTSVEGRRMKTDGWGFTASLEGGYPIVLGRGFTLEPQAQLIYQHVSLDDSADLTGRVLYGDTDVVYGRIGARLSRDWALADNRKLTTWARANLWHTFGSDAETSFPTITGGRGKMKTDLGGSWAQVGIGVSGQVSDNMRLFAAGDYEMAIDAGKGHSLSGRVGMKVVW